MMKKKVLCFVILAVLLVSLVFAQENVIPGEIDEEGNKILNATRKLQEFTEEDRWQYLGGEWRDLILKNEAVSRVDSAFKCINFLFVILFARNYAFSMTLLFVILLWLFTALSLEGYFVFLENKTYRGLAAFPITIVLAHMQLFNYVAKSAFRIIFYRIDWWWGLLSTVIIFAAVFVYFYINKIFAKRIKKGKEEGKKRALEHRVKKTEGFQRGMGEGI